MVAGIRGDGWDETRKAGQGRNARLRIFEGASVEGLNGFYIMWMDTDWGI